MKTLNGLKSTKLQMHTQTKHSKKHNKKIGEVKNKKANTL